MKKLFEHIHACYLLWKMGFFFSTSVTTSEWKEENIKKMGGFFRLNHENPETKKVHYAVADFDFTFENQKLIFVSMKGDNKDLARNTFRYDAKK